MAQTYIQQITGASFPDDLPTLYTDPMLNPGTLYVIDPAHPYGSWINSLPAGEATIPNVAASSAKALMGLQSTADVHALFRRDASMTGSAGLAERTARGGLHGILSQKLTNTQTSVAQDIRLTDAMAAYLWAHRTDNWYFSLWHRVTRAVDPAVGIRSPFAQFTQADANYLAVMQSEGELPAAASGLGTYTTNQAAVGPSFRAIGTNKLTVGWGTPTTFDSPRPVNWGRRSQWGIGKNSAAAPSPSHIFYRATAENLTVSGRTFEQARAADLALYAKDILTPGGRYYEDTFTDPAVIP